MTLLFNVSRRIFQNKFFCLLTLISLIFSGCDKDNSITSPNYVNPEGERKFSTLETPYGNIKPLLVIYTSNKKSYLWFMLQPLGIYTANERAEIIANSLEKYRKEKMSEIEWGELNEERIICARTEKFPDKCQLILTLTPNVSVENVLYLVKCKYEQKDSPECYEPIKS